MIKFCCECEFTHMALGCHVQSGDDVRAWALGRGSGPGLWAGFWVGALSWGSGPGLAGPVRGRQQLSPGTRPDCVLSQLVELQVSRGGYRAFSFSLSCIVVLCDLGKRDFGIKRCGCTTHWPPGQPVLTLLVQLSPALCSPAR